MHYLQALVKYGIWNAAGKLQNPDAEWGEAEDFA